MPNLKGLALVSALSVMGGEDADAAERASSDTIPAALAALGPSAFKVLTSQQAHTVRGAKPFDSSAAFNASAAENTTFNARVGTQRANGNISGTNWRTVNGMRRALGNPSLFRR